MKNTVRSVLIVAAAFCGFSSSASAQCACELGQTRTLSPVAIAQAVLPNNTPRRVTDTEYGVHMSSHCWTMTDYTVHESGLGTTGDISVMVFPANASLASHTQVNEAHQQLLDWLVSVGYQGESLAQAQVAISESLSSLQSHQSSLSAGNGGIQIKAEVSGRGRFTYKGREMARGEATIVETCVPNSVSSTQGMVAYVKQHAVLPRKFMRSNNADAEIAIPRTPVLEPITGRTAVAPSNRNMFLP